MTNAQPKLALLARLYELAGRYVSFADANVATLGGEGLEAQMWRDREVKAKKGYLIEQNRAKREELQKNFEYRQHNDLQHFSRSYARVKGREAGIDFFHMDLCGTVELVAEALQFVSEVVLKSQGRCLAITVADERKNPSIMNFEETLSAAHACFGVDQVTSFLETLTAQYASLNGCIGGDFSSAAKRELGFVLTLARNCLSSEGAPVCGIDYMHRYVYVSGKSDTRMRTYFFHLSRGTGLQAHLSSFLEHWCQGSLEFVRPDGSTIAQTAQKKEDSAMPQPDAAAPQQELVAIDVLPRESDEPASIETLILASTEVAMTPSLLDIMRGVVSAYPAGSSLHEELALLIGLSDRVCHLEAANSTLRSEYDLAVRQCSNVRAILQLEFDKLEPMLAQKE